MAGLEGMAVSTLFERGDHIVRLYEVGEDVVQGQEIIETLTRALEAMGKKVVEKAKITRDKAALQGVASKEPISPKVDSESSGETARDEEEEADGAERAKNAKEDAA